MTESDTTPEPEDVEGSRRAAAPPGVDDPDDVEGHMRPGDASIPPHEMDRRRD